jgi:hypothetical protein
MEAIDKLAANGEKWREGGFSTSLSDDIDGRWLPFPTMARVHLEIPSCSKVGVEGKALKSIFLADL